MSAPRYQDIPRLEMPTLVEDDGTKIKVLIGNYCDKKSPVDGIAANTRYLDIRIEPNTTKIFPIDTDERAFAYIFAGSAHFGNASQPIGVLMEKTLRNFTFGICPVIER